MPDLLTSTERAAITGGFVDNFDTFSRSITIFKEPVKIIVSAPSANTVFGYEDNQNVVNYTYLPVSGVFNARVIYNRKGKMDDKVSEIESAYTDGDCSIKVKENCLSFIQSGQTEKINFDDKFWKIIGGPKIQNFLGLKLFVFSLDEIN